MPDVVHLLNKLARRTRIVVAEGERLGVRQWEEGITDRLLLSVALDGEVAKARGQSWSTVEKATHSREAREGLDFDWIIHAPRRGTLHLAVQAKRPIDGRFHSLRQATGFPQLLRLTTYARVHGAAPVFLMYNDSPDPGSASKYWGCRCGPPQAEALGCALVNPDQVAQAWFQAKIPSFDHLHSPTSALPWRCIFCVFGAAARGSRSTTVDHPLLNALREGWSTPTRSGLGQGDRRNAPEALVVNETYDLEAEGGPIQPRYYVYTELGEEFASGEGDSGEGGGDELLF